MLGHDASGLAFSTSGRAAPGDFSGLRLDARIERRAERALRWTAYGVLSLLLLSNLLVFFQIADVFKPFRVPLGLQSREAYLNGKINVLRRGFLY